MDATQTPLSEDLSPYQIHSRREIVALLRNLGTQRQMINMLADHGSTAIVTSLLEVDDANGSVIIDCAQRERINQHLLASENISFETALDHIRILFFATSVEECLYQGTPALKIDLPASVIRLQRREFYRVPTPIVTPVSCTISIPQDDSAVSRPVSLVLQNVSGGGIALIDEHGMLDPTIGRVYKNCRIDLPGGTLVVASLQLRNIQEIRMHNGRHARRAGCLFVDLPHAMLAAIQRYITKLEREQNARAAGRIG